MEQTKQSNIFVKLGTYALLSMILGIGVVWVFLGIISPVLLLLLIQRW
jgi:hypothetical protein